MNKELIDEDFLITIFKEANFLFLKNEKKLILSGVSERCWYPYFVSYLKSMIRKKGLKGYYVDSEYNKNGNKIKTIYDSDNLIVLDITCDIIIHSRGEILSQDNLLCIEMKKSTASKSSKLKDKKRVAILTKNSFDDTWSYDGKTLPKHVCRYILGIYYEVNIKKSTVYLEYYHHGNIFWSEEISFGSVIYENN